MKSFLSQTRQIQTNGRSEMIDMTPIVSDMLRDLKIQDGMVIVFVPHTTAAVTINEDADLFVKLDMVEKLARMIPKNEEFYQHGEGNSDSHVKTSLVGNSVTVLIEQGKMILGQWQGIYFCEFDGPRQRDIVVKVVSFGE